MFNMTKSVIFSLAAGALFLALYIKKCYKGRTMSGLWTKGSVSVMYLFTAVTSVLANPEMYDFGLMVIIAGVFGLMGDIYLDQKWLHLDYKDDYLSFGFLSFGLGHIVYIGAMLVEAKLELKDFILPAVIGAVVAIGNDILAKPQKLDFGKFRWVVFAYGAIVSFMMGTAISAYLKTKQLGYLLFGIAGVFFLFSDIILSGMYFGKDGKKNTPANFIINIITYYIAQFLIALSPLYLTNIN